MMYPSTARIPLKPLRLLSILLFVMGIGLLTTSGRTSLTCDRSSDDSVRCLIRETTSLGIFETASKRIDAVQSVKIDHKVKHAHDIEGEGESRPIDRDVYGVVLVGNEQVLLDAYDYDRDRQEQRLQKIQSFLQNPDQQQLTLEIRNLWAPVLTLVALGGAIALFFYSK